MLARRRTLISSGLGLLMGLAVATGGSGVIAQDATPPAGGAQMVSTSRPAHVHSGTCDTLGEVVSPLNDLTLAGGGTTTGAVTTMTGASAIPAEYSFTTVPLSLDDMLASDHAINVHFSPENIGTYIACGTIGGEVDANGSLVIGLRELNESGFTGIAVLTTNAADPATTNVSVFIASNLAADVGVAATPEAGVGEEETPDLGIAEVGTPALVATPDSTPGMGN